MLVGVDGSGLRFCSRCRPCVQQDVAMVPPVALCSHDCSRWHAGALCRFPPAQALTTSLLDLDIRYNERAIAAHLGYILVYTPNLAYI